MKRCPACNRVESDDELQFCRVDGTTLVGDSGSVSGNAATARFGSAPVSSESQTSILPHATDASINPPTARTTVLPAAGTPGTTRELSKSSRRKVIVVVAFVCALLLAVVIIGLIASAILDRSRTHTTAITSIAVMPFVNASGNDDVEYLSDGLTESLINSLSRLPSLSVKARSTIFRYKGRDISPQQVGSELKVQAVLNGRVVQRGNQLIVSVDLVNARNGDQIWGEQYSTNMSDAASLQSRLANELSRKLQADIASEDREKLSKGSTTNPEAYLLYLKGRYQTAKYTREGVTKGLEYFEQAVALDPRYALAYDGIADNYIAATDWYIPTKEALPKSGAAARKALEIDDQLAEAHASLATVHWWYDWNWAAADAEFKRAIELNPNDGRTHAFYAWFLICVGRTEAAITENNRARGLDPLSSETNLLVGQTLCFAHRYDEAVAQLKSTLELDQNYWLAHSVMGRSYEQQGKLTEAVAEFQRALDLEKDVPENYAMLAHAYAIAGKRSEAEKLLIQLKDLSTKRYVPPYNIAVVYVGLGDKQQAFAWLERAYSDRSFYLTWLKYDAQLDSLRSDPQFAELTRRVGLP